jgi:hypothetical protein
MSITRTGANGKNGSNGRWNGHTAGAASTIAAGAASTNYSFTDTTSAAVDVYSTAIGGFWGGLLVSG